MPHGTVCLCLDPTGLNQALNGPVHRHPTLNGLFPKLVNAQWLMLIGARSGYHNLKGYKITFAY